MVGDKSRDLTPLVDIPLMIQTNKNVKAKQTAIMGSECEQASKDSGIFSEPTSITSHRKASHSATCCHWSHSENIIENSLSSQG